MRRLGFVVLALGLLTSATVTARAQVPRPPQGGVGTLAAGGGGGGSYAPWMVWSEPPGPYPITLAQYPLLQFFWCDDLELNPGTRWIKVNGVVRTSSFSYSEEEPSGNCVSRARLATTSVALNVGSNLIEMYICDADERGPYCGTSLQYVTRLAGPLPVVSLAPYSADLQDVGRCAIDCFAASYAQSTVPYYTLETPRSVTLAYHGDRVDPKPFVHVDVTHGGDGSNLPTAFRLRVRRDNGQYVTFLNGETTLRFTTSTATLRLGGQFGASANGMGNTGVYSISIIVEAEYAAGVEATTTATRLIVVNENDSPIARGWTLAGVQRLYAAGGALITEGDGSAVYFSWNGSSYSAPAGEFSRLTVAGGVYTRAYPDSTKVLFNSAGRMTEIRDRFNNATTFSYDGSNRLWQILDPAGKAIWLAYGDYGLQTVLGFGPTTTVTVGSSRRLTAIVDPDGDSTRFGYDGANRLDTITNRGGATTTLGYDSTSGKLASVTAPAVTIHSGQEVQPVTALAAWQRVSVPYNSTSGTPFAAARADTVRAGVTDAGGHTARFTVNGFGQPLHTTGPLGDTVTVTYNAGGQPLTATDRLGVNASYTYDGTGFQTAATVGGLTTYSHNGGWGLADSIWGATPRQRISIGANGRINWTQLDGTYATSYAYNPRGQVTSVTSPAGELEVMHWYGGPRENVTMDSVPGGRATTYEEDAWGRDTLVQHPGLPPRTTTYDPLGRPTAIRDGVNPNPTVYGYDVQALRSVTDPKGQVWSYNYNALGWLTSRVDPAGRRDSFAYDVEGQVRRVINRRGQVIELTYDALHRQLTRTGSAITSDTMSYSGDGRVIAASNGVAQEVTYLNSRLVPDSVATAFRAPGDPSRVYRRRFWYQPVTGLLESVTDSGPYVTLLSRGYAHKPTRGTLDSLRFGPGAWTRLQRNSELAVDTTRFPNNDVLALGYVTADDLDRISSPLMDDRYNRDARGRLRQVFPQPAVGREFKYDSLGHLRRLVYGVPDGITCYDDPDLGWICDLLQDSTIHFEHDPVGNRTLRSAPGGDAVGTYGPGDRILTYGGCSYGTDFDGNVIARSCGAATDSFSWSGDGRLSGYTVAGGPTVGLFYDAAGRLVRRDVNGTPASYFLWDGDNLLAELDGNQYLVAQYSYYPGLDRLHAFNRGGTVSYAQADAEGNVRYLGTNVYNQMRSYVYDESGNLVGGWDWGSLNGTDRARWKGALYLAPEAGLYYMRARWYEPRTGRFLSEDPAGLAGGLNPYIFAGADPVNGMDPSGMSPCEPGEDGHWDDDYTYVDSVLVGRIRSWHHCRSNLPYDPSSLQQVNECREYGGTRDCSDRFNVPEPPRALRAAASSCGVSMGMFALSAATDLAFFTGVGVAMKGLRAISFAGRMSARYFERKMYQSAAVAMAEAGAMSWSTIPGRAGAYSVGAYATGREHQAAETWMSGEFHASDLIPGIASYNAWRRMRASCQ